ncbi:MAG: c-type cytochrome domain-containing protein, partial [Nannocystaceae bacterium]
MLAILRDRPTPANTRGALRCDGNPVDFNRDVRPLLTKNCTTCHGGVKKAGEVSFLYREDVIGKGESGKPVAVPGDPATSEMIRRLNTSDPDDRMPPPDHHPHPLPQ